MEREIPQHIELVQNQSEDEEFLRLLRRVRRGSEAATRELIERYASGVWALLGTWESSYRRHAAPDDLFQEIWDGIIRNLRSGKITLASPAVFGGLVAKHTRFAMANASRKARRINAHSTDGVDVDILADQDPPPWICADWAQRSDIAARAFDELSERDQLALSLMYTSPLSTVEVAEEVGVTVSQLYVILHRARARLKQALSEEFGDEDFWGS